MPKRSVDDIHRKIKKLMKKLKRRRRSRSTTDSDSDNEQVRDILDSPEAQTITEHIGFATQHPENPLPVTLEKVTAELVSTNDEGPSEN